MLSVAQYRARGLVENPTNRMARCVFPIGALHKFHCCNAVESRYCSPRKKKQVPIMSEVWETKDGRRRVRRDPPSLEEAVVAAQGLTDDFKGQVEIVASLMEVSVDEARGAVLRMGQRKGVNHVTVTDRVGAPRAVVVERRTPRYAMVQRRSIGR